MRTIERVADGVWEMCDEMGPFPIRMTVLETSDGLVLWSPTRLDAAAIETLSGLGHVHSIVAPNLFHHVFAQRAKEHFPNALVIAPKSLSKKRPDLHIDARHPTAVSSLTTLTLQGCDRIEETVAYHEQSRTLVVTDVVFNVRQAVGWKQWMVFRLVAGTLGGVGQSRLWRSLRTDAKALQRSLEQMLELPFERVMLAHGDTIERDAKDTLVAALRLRTLARLAA